jgi:hypothetical protein
LVNFGDIQRISLDLHLGRLHNVMRRFRERRLPARTDQHLHALSRQRAGRLKTNSFAAAGDERRLACKTEVHPSPPLNISAHLVGASFY